MQGQSQRGGLRGGRRGFGGPTGGGGNKQDKQNKPDQSADVAIGPGGMTPGPGPGGTMVAGATPPGLGQSVAQGGTTAGFAGQPSPGSGAAQSLQDLFAAQQPPEGIATLSTLPPDQELMDFVNLHINGISSYQLLAGRPPKPIENCDKSLDDMGLCNASLVVQSV